MAPLAAEERLRYWADHPAGQAAPMRADLIAAADEMTRLDTLRKQAEHEKQAAVADVVRLTLRVEALARELQQQAVLSGQLMRDQYSAADVPACTCGQGDKPATIHFSGCPVSPLYDSSGDAPAVPPADEEETPCPKRDDGIHCECWYEGKACCGCGASAILNGREWPPCTPVTRRNDP